MSFVFPHKRALLPVLHVRSVDQAFTEIQNLLPCDIDGLFLINMDTYAINADRLLDLYQKIRSQYPTLWLGLNLLDVDVHSILPHLPADLNGYWSDISDVQLHGDCAYAEAVNTLRKTVTFKGLYFGGVAFKYQAPVSYTDLAPTAQKATHYMDVVTTSGDATGKPPLPDKIQQLRNGLGQHGHLAIASGITPDNVHLYPQADAFLVATGVSHDFYTFDTAKVRQLRRCIDAME